MLRTANSSLPISLPLPEGREGTAWESSDQRSFLTPTQTFSVISALTATPSFLILSFYWQRVKSFRITSSVGTVAHLLTHSKAHRLNPAERSGVLLTAPFRNSLMTRNKHLVVQQTTEPHRAIYTHKHTDTKIVAPHHPDAGRRPKNSTEQSRLRDAGTSSVTRSPANYVHYRIHNSLSLTPILGHMNPIHIIQPIS